MSVIPTQYLSPRDVGQLLGTSDSTVRRMIRRNELQAIRMPPGNHFKITPAEVLRYADENEIPIVTANRQMLERMAAVVKENGHAQLSQPLTD